MMLLTVILSASHVRSRAIAFSRRELGGRGVVGHDAGTRWDRHEACFR